MPTYELQCDDCGHVHEHLCSFAEWDRAKKEGKSPLPTVCPKCGSVKFYRIWEHSLKTETSPEQQQARLKNQIREDTEKLKKGDMDFIRNIAGDKPISGKSGVKYMKDVKNAKIKRK